MRSLVFPLPGWMASAGLCLASIALSLVFAFVAATPDAQFAFAPLALLVVLTVGLALPPTAFLLVAFAAFATLQLTAEYTVALGPATAYGGDLIVGLVFLRGLLPRDRLARSASLGLVTRIAVSVWIVLMCLAALRAVEAGTSFESAIRVGMALVYWPLLYFGFSRAFSERDFDVDRFFTGLCGIGVALIGYMFAMRAIGRTFESPETVGRLGEVMASSGAVFRRDYGLHSAFIVYPAVALVAIGRLVYDRGRTLAWIAVAALCVVATLLTLIRAEIFGLAAGIVAVLALSGNFRSGSGVAVPRRSAVAGVVIVLIGAGAVVTIVDQGLASIVTERSVGLFTEQSAEAQATLDVRVEALDVGLKSAGDDVFGIGLLSPEQQLDRGINPTFLAHSGYATMLVYVGWPGLLAGLLAIVGLVVDSMRRSAARPWLHPVMVGILALLLVYSFGASGIVGQEQVMALGALLVAARFAVVPKEQVERSGSVDAPTA